MADRIAIGCALAEAFKVVRHVLVQQLVLGEQLREPPQLRAVGQLAHHDQMRHFDERGSLGQLLDGNAAVAQYSLLAVDESDLAPARTRVAVAVIQGDVAAPLRRDEISTARSCSVPSMTGSV